METQGGRKKNLNLIGDIYAQGGGVDPPSTI